MRTRLLLFSAVAIALFGTLSPAGASAPTTTSGDETVDTFAFSCGTFDVWDYIEFSWSGTEHYDADGNLIRVEERVYGFDRLYNKTTGESVEGTYSNHETVDLANGDVTQNGQIFRIVIPGAGAIFLDVGKFVITFGEGLTFLAGHHDFFDEQVEAICAYLA